MIGLPRRNLPSPVLKELEELQGEVNAFPSYPEQVRAAIDLWPSRRQRKVFQAIEEALGAICSGPRRCMFCEDNAAYQIEHFRPRSLYPALAFAWANYLYACGQCNGPKSNRFAIFSESGAVIEIARSDMAPADGQSVLLDPRWDEPMEYLWLELRDTFLFKSAHPSGTVEHERADLTIRWLGLNRREELVEARSVAYDDYRSRLVEYAQNKRDGADPASLERLRRALRRKGHVTVWREMQRQHEDIDELRSIFEEVPEALRW